MNPSPELMKKIEAAAKALTAEREVAAQRAKEMKESVIAMHGEAVADSITLSVELLDMLTNMLKLCNIVLPRPLLEHVIGQAESLHKYITTHMVVTALQAKGQPSPREEDVVGVIKIANKQSEDVLRRLQHGLEMSHTLGAELQREVGDEDDGSPD